MVVAAAPKTHKWEDCKETTRALEHTEVSGPQELPREGKDKRPTPAGKSSTCWSVLSGSLFRNDCSPSLKPSSGESDGADANQLSGGKPLG